MATDFFERQRRARGQSQWLRLVFALAMVFSSVVIAMGIVLLLGTAGLGAFVPRAQQGVLVAAFHKTTFGWWLAGAVLVFMLGVSGITAWRLRGSGAALAQTLRGRQLDPETSRPAERQLLNIVAEMALASQVPNPGVYVLDREDAINAFAAGKTLEGAVVGVTAGALRSLDRDEMQAVVAHEFSHILNGDMALNTRLIAWLSGLFAIERFARSLRGERRYAPDRDGKGRGRLSILFWWWHLGFWFFHACGYVGLFTGRLLQAAICRRREALADASAVQFTRNPRALKSALLKIEAAAGSGRVMAAGAPGMAHMFFAAGDSGVGGWFARLRESFLETHPPMEQRVRALDARMTSTQFRAAVRNVRKAQLAQDAQAKAPVALGGETLAPRARPDPAAAPALPADLLCSRLNSEQQQAVAALREQYGASADDLVALFVAAMLETSPAHARQRLVQLAPVLGAAIATRVPQALNRLAGLAAIARMPLLEGVAPALASLPDPRRLLLVKLARAFGEQIRPRETLRFATSRLLLRTLVHQPPSPRPAAELQPLASAASEVGVVLAVMAQQSGERGAQAYAAGMNGLLPPGQRPAFAPEEQDGAAVDAALARLAPLPYVQRGAIGTALVRVIAANGTLAAGEMDLLRTLCAGLDIYAPATGAIRLEPAAEPRSAPRAAGAS